MTELAACPAGADEVEPHGPVSEFDGRASERSPATHGDPPASGLEDGDEISLDIRLDVCGRRQWQELLGDRLVPSRPA